MFKFLGAAVAAGTLVAATSASAFAFFTPINSDPMFSITTHQHPLDRTGVDITPLTPDGQANVKFTFSGLEGHAFEPYAAGLYALGALDAHLSFSATEIPFPYDKTYQSRGTIKITYAGASPLTANGKTYNTGAVLDEESSWPGRVSPTAGYANFMGSGASQFLPGWFPWGYVFGFNFATTGSGPTQLATLRYGSIGYAVPEPATWTMLIIGFGLTGTALRRRRQSSAVA